MKMEKKNPEKIIKESVEWYTTNRTNYKLLCQKVESIIKEILEAENISIHTTSCRAKDIDSFAQKIEDPKYNNPKDQITDLSGIRIIAYVENDVEKINKLIENAFEIDYEKSLNKTDELGVDKVGYRSVHYIAKLKSQRLQLPEYKRFDGLFFEIQIRTILQHAWAEIEHDKNYKFSGKLDDKIKRRFKILAGLLELADREFDSLASEIDEITTQVEAATKSGELDIEINSTTLKSYLHTKFSKLIEAGLIPNFASMDKDLMEELSDFGLRTLADLDRIVPADFIDKHLKYEDESSNFLGLLRHIMIINNYKKYFDHCWKRHFGGFSDSSVDFLSAYGIHTDKIEQEYNMNK
jgi:ppGpp synthetase/RelA/SpoT-type nucleotidyltranferase